MKKNFLVTTSLIDTWEFKEKNFLLGRWCEFYEFYDSDEEKFNNKIPKKDNVVKNIDHWEDRKKKIKDYEYLEKRMDYLLEIISEKLSAIHNINENKEYWRVVIFGWLSEYSATIFNKWELIRIFFKENDTEKFYSNFISFNDLDYVPKNHLNFKLISQKDEWNHLIFLRLFHFLNIQNLSLIEKKITRNNIKEEPLANEQNLPFMILVIKSIDNIISKFAFKFNKIIFDSFYFPRNEYLKICLRCKLIPSKYSNFFDFQVKKNSLSKVNNDKRIRLKNLLLKIDSPDKFIQFLLKNIHKDMPKSYLENFDEIRKRFLPLAKEKKIIFSMHSIEINDNFRIYLAETKKVGSKYIHSVHGGGLDSATMGQYFNFFEKVSDKIVMWNNNKQKQDIYANLSPTLPTIKLKNPKIGSNCSIIFYEVSKYILRITRGMSYNQYVDFFNEFIQFVNGLNPEIKSKIKFRTKHPKPNTTFSYNCEKKFSEMFGEKYIDKISLKNPVEKTMLNSKLVINTFPETTFSQAMHSNFPTILMTKKDHFIFSKEGSHTFDDLKKNKIAFEDFDEAKTHINKYWKDLDSWWKSENVQSARKRYLINFFNVKPEWFKEWSDYIYFLKKL